MKMSITVFVVNPFGRLQFDGLYQLGQRFRRIYPNEEMQMVSHTIDGVNVMFAIFARTNDITEKTIPPFVLKQTLPAVNGKNDVYVNLSICVCHVLDILCKGNHISRCMQEIRQ